MEEKDLHFNPEYDFAKGGKTKKATGGELLAAGALGYALGSQREDSSQKEYVESAQKRVNDYDRLLSDIDKEGFDSILDGDYDDYSNIGDKDFQKLFNELVKSKESLNDYVQSIKDEDYKDELNDFIDNEGFDYFFNDYYEVSDFKGKELQSKVRKYQKNREDLMSFLTAGKKDFAKGGRTNNKVSKKIRLLKKEGYPHDQAVAIALSMRDSGKLARGGKYNLNPSVTKRYARSLNRFDYNLNKVYDMAEKLSERPKPILGKGGYVDVEVPKGNFRIYRSYGLDDKRKHPKRDYYRSDDFNSMYYIEDGKLYEEVVDENGNLRSKSFRPSQTTLKYAKFAKGGKVDNDFKEQTLDFKYKGKRHTFTFTPEESDEWVTFKSKGIDFDVHYDEDDNNIVVYEYIKELKTQPYDTIHIQDIKYAKGGVTKNNEIIEQFLDEKTHNRLRNISIHYADNEDLMLLRNYGTLIATRKGNNVKVSDKKYSSTTSTIQNAIVREAKERGMKVKRVGEGEFAKGGKTRKSPFKRGDMVYSYENPDNKMEISFVRDNGIVNGVDYGWSYKVALKTDGDGKYNPKGKYSKSSKWFNQPSKTSRKNNAKKVQQGKMSKSEFMKIWGLDYDYWKDKNIFSDGGFIQEAVKEMKEKGTTGSFTKQAKNAGMTTTAFAKKVLKNPKKFTEKTRKRAIFMKNTNPDKFNFGGEIVREYDVNINSGVGTYARGGKISKDDAIVKALKMGVDFNKDFHAQSFGNELTQLAKETGYRKSKSSSGSTGRAFFEHLERRYDKNPSYYDKMAKQMARGGKMQGYNAQLDESLGMRRGAKRTKQQSDKDRRDEAKAMNKAMGRRAYASVRGMDKGRRMMSKGGEVRDINKFKKQLTAKAKRKGIYENFGQSEVRKLENKYGYTNNVREFENWAMNFDLSQMAKGGKINRVGDVDFPDQYMDFERGGRTSPIIDVNKRVYVDNSYFMQYVDLMASRITEIYFPEYSGFDDNTEARNFYEDTYDSIERDLNKILNVYPKDTFMAKGGKMPKTKMRFSGRK